MAARTQIDSAWLTVTSCESGYASSAAFRFIADGPGTEIEQYELVKQASCKRPTGCARTYLLPQHSHKSEVYAINTEDTRLTDEILEFVKAGK